MRRARQPASQPRTGSAQGCTARNRKRPAPAAEAESRPRSSPHRIVHRESRAIARPSVCSALAAPS
jgi:hypothetical protein